MAERMDCFLLYARRWQLGRQTAVTAVSGLLWIGTPLSMYDVPARDGVQGALWPLIPVLFAATLPTVLGTGAEVQERTAPHPARLRVLTTALVLAMAAAVTVCGIALGPGIAVRNTLLLVGLAFCGTWLLPAGGSWGPPVLVPMIMWLVGNKPQGEVEPWAVLLLPSEIGYTWVIAVSVFMLGLSGYVRTGPRG